MTISWYRCPMCGNHMREIHINHEMKPSYIACISCPYAERKR